MPDIRERTDAYIHARHQHPAWQLLGTRRAPLILSCLQTLFEESQNGIDFEDCLQALSHLLAQHANHPDFGFGEKQFWTNPASADRYANMVVAKGWDNPATIVQSFITPETTSMGLVTVLDGREAITFPITALPAVNADAAKFGGIKPLRTYGGGQ